jgi:hypothetical protein
VQSLKETESRDFQSWFFYQTMYGMKYLSLYMFLIWFPFKGEWEPIIVLRRFPRNRKGICDLIETAGSEPCKRLSRIFRGMRSNMLFLKFLSRIPRFNGDRGTGFRGLMKPWKRILRNQNLASDYLEYVVIRPWIIAPGEIVWWKKQGSITIGRTWLLFTKDS